MILPRVVFVFCLGFSIISSSAQHFGGHPLSRKWKQINTDTVRVIFPPGLEKEASEVANISHRVSQLTANSIGNNLRKINIVLQDLTTISNGYVGLGPSRSEFQLTPLQNSFQLGSIPWHHTLALHEYRHVQQYNNFRKGISKGFYYLFGEQGQDFANSTAIPNWFWEGDAVLQETIMSKQGRGRLPYFLNGYRSLWNSGKNYSWMKLRNGSLRDYVPDHYQLGYILASYGREKYGEDFWKKVTDDAVRFKGVFYPFQQAIKKYSGTDFKSFRQEAFAFFRNKSVNSDGTDSVSVFAAKHKHLQANEEYPQWVDSSTVIFVQSNYKRIAAFTTRNVLTGIEKKIRYRGISLDNYFSYNNGKLVYVTYESDIRWGWRDFSILNVLDIKTGSNKTVTKKSKYFSPDIDSSGNRIIAAFASNVTWNELHIIRVADGIISRIPIRQKLFFTYPKFYNSTEAVSAARDSTGNMMLVKINIETGSITRITPAINAVIGFPQVSGDTILFTASDGYQDKLFCVISNEISKIEASGNNKSTGSYHADIGANKICWTDFTAVGYRVKDESLLNMSFTKLDGENFAQSFSGVVIREMQSGQDFLSSIEKRIFPITKYSRSSGLFRIHSWSPDITDPEYTFSVISENTLNTLQSEMFLRYNRNEKSKQLGFAATYAALFPWIRLGTNYTFDRQARFNSESVFWNEWEGNVGFIIPLNLTRGGSYRNLYVGTDLIYNKRYYSGNFKDSFDSRGFAYFNSFLNFTNQIQQARRQIYPRFAQSLSIRYSKALNVYDANQFMATGDWYFPGISMTHNLVMNTAIHLRDTMRSFRFSNVFPFSRGYIAENFQRMYKFGADYHFPIVYPDRGFASVVYFLRIRVALFYDHTNVIDYLNNGRTFQDAYRSLGTEIYFDTKWWNQLPVSVGVRYSRLLDAEKQNIANNQWEIVLPVSLQ